MNGNKIAIVTFLNPPVVVEYGLEVKLLVRVTNEQGDDRRPDTLRLKIMPPSGVLSTVSGDSDGLTRAVLGAGTYAYSLKADEAGRWKVRAEAEGRFVGAGEISFRVRGSAFYDSNVPDNTRG